MHNRKTFAFALLLLFIFGCSGKRETALDPSDFNKAVSNPAAQILDVRTDAEYQSGHIPHALLANWKNQSQFMERIPYLDKSKPVYVYCLSGGRSAAAAEWMRQNGFTEVYELKGGIAAWRNASMPLEGQPDGKQMTKQEYDALVNQPGFALVDFGAEWCPPCKKMEPVLAQLRKDNPELHFVNIDGGINADVMKQMNVDALPVFILYKNGKPTWRKQGVVTIDEFKSQIQSN